MTRLLFRFQQFADEIDAIAEVAHRFVSPETPQILREHRESLEGIRGGLPNQERRWEITPGRPLRTITSRGNYERTPRRGILNVFAEVTSTWIIRPTGAADKKSYRNRQFELSGNASTVVRIFDDLENEPRELAMWRMDVADNASPGCYFHMQVLGETEMAPFPHPLSVPRFPSHLVTPSVALEFVLAELFQDEWPSQVAKETYSLQQWRAIQSLRLRSVLEWQIEQLRETSATPWVALKSSKPDASLFVENEHGGRR